LINRQSSGNPGNGSSPKTQNTKDQASFKKGNDPKISYSVATTFSSSACGSVDKSSTNESKMFGSSRNNPIKNSSADDQ
jgi:hypothetical protein